jgi:hypothetical protein
MLLCKIGRPSLLAFRRSRRPQPDETLLRGSDGSHAQIARRVNLSQLTFTPNHNEHPAYPVPPRGAYRDRHGRWVRDAVDALAAR